MEYHDWSKVKGSDPKKCTCCNLTLKQIKKQNEEKRATIEETAKENTLFLLMLDLFNNDVDLIEGIWYGEQCRRCSGAPKTVGEMFLAKYTEGWLCNKCYARKPEDSKGRWLYIPTPDEEEIDESYLTIS